MTRGAGGDKQKGGFQRKITSIECYYLIEIAAHHKPHHDDSNSHTNFSSRSSDGYIAITHRLYVTRCVLPDRSYRVQRSAFSPRQSVPRSRRRRRRGLPRQDSPPGAYRHDIRAQGRTHPSCPRTTILSLELRQRDGRCRRRVDDDDDDDYDDDCAASAPLLLPRALPHTARLPSGELPHVLLPGVAVLERRAARPRQREQRTLARGGVRARWVGLRPHVLLLRHGAGGRSGIGPER